VIITTVKSSIVLFIKFIGLQDGIMQVEEILCVANGNIPVNAIIFLEIDPEFQYSHVAFLDKKIKQK
jgi:hypothetical protein